MMRLFPVPIQKKQGDWTELQLLESNNTVDGQNHAPPGMVKTL